MKARRTTLLAVLVVLLAGCGGESSDAEGTAGETAPQRQADGSASPQAEGREVRSVRDTMARWMLASMRQDIPGMCRVLTAESRKLLAKKGREIGAGDSCVAMLSARRDTLATPKAGTPEGAAAVAASLPVEIRGKRATAEVDGDKVPLRRERDGWRLDLAEALGLN